MRSCRLVALSVLFLTVWVFRLDSGWGVDEKAVETIEATLRATCKGDPVRDLRIKLDLVDSQSGREFKVKGMTDRRGVFSFNIPSGIYKCRGSNIGTCSGLNGPSTSIAGPDGDTPFNLTDYYNAGVFWVNEDKIITLGPDSAALPEIKFIPRFELFSPLDGSTIEELLPVFTWKSVEGAESYTIVIHERTQKGRNRGLRSFLREQGINSTQWRLATPAFESGKTYVVMISAIGHEGQRINKSKIAEFTIAAGDAKETQ